MPVNLDITNAYKPVNNISVNSIKYIDKTLERNVTTGQMNLIKNGAYQGLLSKQQNKAVDLTLLSKIDFNKIKPNAADFTSGRSLDDIVKKLVKYAKA